jgi:hypothetical protein
MNAATWITASLAAAVAMVAWFPWMRRSLNHRAFADQIIKLCGADNVERARKLCNAAPDNPMVAACGKCLAALADGGDEPESETIARLREIYGVSLKADLARLSRHIWIGLVAIVLVAVAVYLVSARGGPPVALALAAVAAAILVRAYRLARKLAVDPAAEGERLFPVMAAARRR